MGNVLCLLVGGGGVSGTCEPPRSALEPSAEVSIRTHFQRLTLHRSENPGKETVKDTK